MLAGIEPGDELVEVEGRAVSDELGLAEVVASLQADAAADILVRREGADRRLRLVVAETPVLASLGGGRCNRRLVELEAEFARGRREPQLRLEAGVCRLLLGDPARALRDHLTELDLPNAAGVGAGTVLYYRGLALEALSEPLRAAESFEAAAGVAGATLVTHDGPLLAPLARRRAGRSR